MSGNRLFVDAKGEPVDDGTGLLECGQLELRRNLVEHAADRMGFEPWEEG